MTTRERDQAFTRQMFSPGATLRYASWMSGKILRRAALALSLIFALLLWPNDLFAIATPSPASGIDPHGPPPPAPENPPAAPTNPPLKFRRAALEKFVAAYLDAARASDPEPEGSFFADRVDYHGRPNTSREKIQQELAQDRARWPERRIEQAAQAAVDPMPNGQLRVSLSLHFDFHHEKEQSSDEIIRILLLEPQGPHSFRIVGLSERKPAP
ncbi:MAG: hypothetical protein H0X40_19340 [Chthoniobacterales bacterium]|nr:hypothetical protein [Chthoniobacterales bacterium]